MCLNLIPGSTVQVSKDKKPMFILDHVCEAKVGLINNQLTYVCKHCEKELTRAVNVQPMGGFNRLKLA